ncbi:dipeptide ABC transporter ATP-binding protein [Microbacterium sp. SA39]|uniref:dipeptide ABC transporter ATP-binding protein n=1 Tax=Microbacterium sp. SA39 TaxID=1263625 RepID=UPI00061ED831|nr:ABC transporter ATP-binding protein [Microbacterium sp. SA39]KJQ54369.1 Glutathione import ATP-binding protein GsiA [Microbacterium sp. SA39]
MLQKDDAATADESTRSGASADPAHNGESAARDDILRVEDLRIAYRIGDREVDAVRGVSLSVKRGEVVAIVGESGSGKSTVAQAIMNLLAPNAEVTGGRVVFEGEDLLPLSERRWRGIRGRLMGLVPQDPALSLNPVRRVGVQVAEPLLVHGLASKHDAADRAIELLEMAGLTYPAERAKQYPHQFSGGMKQRALIAGALAARPSLVIADEPTSALDVTVQKQILDHLAHLTQELGTSILLITHDLGMAAERADRVIVMRQGEIVDAGPAAQVMTAPTHEYTRKLIDAAPRLSAHERRTASTQARIEFGGEPIVRVSELTKIFPLPKGEGDRRTLTALDAVSLEVRRGETLAVVGESGSGKSTLGRLVLRLDEPTSGAISFAGEDITHVKGEKLRQLRRRFQMVYQSPFDSLNPRMTIEQLITEPLLSFGEGDRSSRSKRAVELSEQVALPDGMLDRFPDELSGGQRQRVAIARALALDPEFLVLDEAVSALDVSVQAQILKLLDELQRERELSYLFITHDLGVVAETADRIAVLKNGILVECGDAGQIFTNPQQEYTRMLIEAVPAFSA